MDGHIFTNLAQGFIYALTPTNLLFAFLGALIGTLIGVLPGIGPIGTMSLLLSATYGMEPTTAIIMFCGIYYGSMYGGSTTSILMNLPGEGSAVVTMLDGYQMTKKGRAGAALAIAAIGSFVAATLGILILTFVAPAIANVAVKFGPPEYFGITILGFILLAQMGRGSMIRSLMMICVGLLLSFIGMDMITGSFRFTFGLMELGSGLNFVPVAMGFFGISEVLLTAEESSETNVIIPPIRLRELLPNKQELKKSVGPTLRGTLIGFANGVIPGPAPLISTITSYAVEKKISKHPEEFGKGAVEGVAGPESANNAASVAAFVPLLTLGIPFAPAMAMMLTALTIHGIQPGPLLISEHPTLFWGILASMYIGNAMLLVLNLPLVSLFVKVLQTPKHLLMAFITLIAVIGAYGVNNSVFDVFVMVIAGLFGYLCKKIEFDATPLVLAIVLGPLMENSLRQSLIMGGGNFGIFMERPVSFVLLIGTSLVLLFQIIKRIASKRIAYSNS